MTDLNFDAFDSHDLEQLRALWSERLGTPPRLRSRSLMALMLAWRLQATAEGGLEPEMHRAIRRKSGLKTPGQLTPGTKLTREWKGAPHEVVVEDPNRFLYRSEVFASLSEVARRITGVRWNGPRFFGLRAGERGR